MGRLRLYPGEFIVRGPGRFRKLKGWRFGVSAPITQRLYGGTSNLSCSNWLATGLEVSATRALPRLFRELAQEIPYGLESTYGTANRPIR